MEEEGQALGTGDSLRKVPGARGEKQRGTTGRGGVRLHPGGSIEQWERGDSSEDIVNVVVESKGCFEGRGIVPHVDADLK